MYKLIICDLDDTLLRRDKTVSPHTLDVLRKCRERGILLGAATARSALNAARYIDEVSPDVVISSGGALGVFRGETLVQRGFSAEETASVISSALRYGCEITVDAIGGHYVSYSGSSLECPWSEQIDMSGYHSDALKICVETPDQAVVQRIADEANGCDCVRFSGSDWWMLRKSGVTKESALAEILPKTGLTPADVIAFGDDLSDIGMLKFCGRGVAMKNAQEAVKEAADDVTCDCDDDGVARYIEENIL